jgi:hypothetical protein
MEANLLTSKGVPVKKLAWIAGATGIGLATLVGGSISYGADHRDSAMLAMAANSAADLNDVYAWMNSSATKLNLVMTIQPFAAADATVSPNVQYVFHVASMDAFGAATQTETDIICEFASATSAQCWVGASEYVTGDPSSTSGLTSADGKVKLFVGQRKDPFFFNLDGFKQAVSDAEAAVGSGAVTLDSDGCAQVDGPTSAVLVNDLTHDSNGTTATTTLTDDFATANVVAIVMQVDKSLVNAGGDILGVYASTHAKP